MSRNLVQRIPANKGFNYLAGEAASPFLVSLTASYSQKLKERASWAVERFADVPTADVRRITRRLFEDWSSQFQVLDRPGGGQ